MPDWPRARKQYECLECGQTIHIGRVYVRRFNKAKQKPEHFHPACFKCKGPGGRTLNHG